MVLFLGWTPWHMWELLVDSGWGLMCYLENYTSHPSWLLQWYHLQNSLWDYGHWARVLLEVLFWPLASGTSAGTPFLWYSTGTSSVSHHSSSFALRVSCRGLRHSDCSPEMKHTALLRWQQRPGTLTGSHGSTNWILAALNVYVNPLLSGIEKGPFWLPTII